ncbi:ribokinase [Nesterenkonia halophila]|uniref:ribokinase n=1 Tax=Nesterenkonia halophila TaxID=302044 RepID=UPI001292A94C|nr:ribokinase [Nesterenkonia halophila]
MTLLVMGSVNQDLTIRVPEFPRPGETLTALTLETSDGGKSANQAVAASLVGATSCLVARTGPDAAGEQAVRVLEEAGVRSDGVSCGTEPTGTAFISVRDDGENTIVVLAGANAQLRAEDCSAELLADASWLLLSMEIPQETVREAAARARAAGVPVALNASPLSGEPVDLRDVDMVVVNDGEAARLLGRDPSEVADVAAALGVGTAVITHGGDGATVHRADASTIRIPGVPVDAVDTTGCGDALAGALLGRLTCGDAPAEAGKIAARFAAEAATRAGAQTSYPRDFVV